MRISTLISRLEEVRQWAGGEDLDVVVGETNGSLQGRIDVVGDNKGKYDNESWGQKIAIVKAYTILN